MSAAPQFDFLRTYIEKLLDENGFNELSEDTRREYIPQFVAEAQRRIGVGILPLLSPASADELAQILQSENTTPETLQNFWQRAVPNFESVVQQTLQDFALEFKNVIASIQ